MNAALVTFAALAVAGTCWVLTAARRAGRRGLVALRPERAGWLRGLGLAEAGDFLKLDALVISGHPGRSVGRLALGGETVYLKRESGVGWRARLTNFLAGHGWVSRSVREARVLAALERDGLPAPRWLAAGEDGRGGAFLLVEEVAAARPLTAALREAPPNERLRLAANLGRLMARLHAAGFFHRDLYAKHVLVSGPSRALYLLDWQRAGRGATTARAARARDLACLHATLADELAGPRERVACLKAYLGDAAPRRELRRWLADIEALAARLRQRRHIREKRQGAAVQQAWSVVDGEALAVTPALTELAGGRGVEWLDLRRQPAGPTPVSRRWVVLAGGRPVLLVRRRRRLSRLAELWRRLRGRALRADELRLSTLLWRLERHGVAAPRVLAVGQRRDGTRLESFLLTAPLAGTVRVTTWVKRAEAGVRRRVLGELGVMLARLHEACCYLVDGAEQALAVQVGAGGDRPVVANAESLTPQRQPRPDLARADINRLAGLLGPEGWSAVLAGYGRNPSPPAPSPAGRGGAKAEDRNGRAVTPQAGSGPPSPFGGGGGGGGVTAGPWRVVQRGDWADFAGPGWLDEVMDREVTDRHQAKQGRSTGRLALGAPDGRRLVVYLKRHYGWPSWGGWFAGRSPAMTEYAHLEWARSQGVPVPAPVAAGERVGPGGRRQSFLAVEELAGMLPLSEAIPLAASALSADDFRRWKRGLVVEVARLARLLHDRRHFHKDLYLCHFYVCRDDALRAVGPAAWRGRVALIDLHRLAHHPRTWRLWQIKDLAQLLYSSELPGLDGRDRAAFWAAYRGPGHGGWPAWLLRRLVVLKWRLYRKHNLKRRARA